LTRGYLYAVSIDYLGNKSSLLDFVLAPILALDDVQSVADPFCGTGVVSGALANAGKTVVAGDTLELCATLAEAVLLSSPAPAFQGLQGDVPQAPGESMHSAVVRSLNDAAAIDGFIYRTYSPASAESIEVARMYLTEANAAKIDGIRRAINQLSPVLTPGERALLLTSLVIAVSRVSNTAGTYGCYLKRWKARARDNLKLEPCVLTTASSGPHQVVRCDAESLVRAHATDLVYLDPPYTKRQYAAYYHLLDTIVRGDEPAVTGSTGLPRWQDRSSDFCYRARAGNALRRVIEGVQARHVVLSYNEDGQIDHDEILAILDSRGPVRVYERPLRRYRSNYALPHRGPVVSERLYHLAISG
jgi:adenine-specific DNA-methyltransferase